MLKLHTNCHLFYYQFLLHLASNMEIFHKHSLIIVIMQFFILCFLCFMVKGEVLNNRISAFYVFGDSTVDAGNNNYIITAFKSNFPPYGRDFPNHVPTGRFTNGKLATDYIGNLFSPTNYIFMCVSIYIYIACMK